MTHSYLSNRPGEGRTFSTVMWIVGLVASIQVFAVGFAVMKRGPEVTGSEIPATIPIESQLSDVAPPDLIERAIALAAVAAGPEVETVPGASPGAALPPETSRDQDLIPENPLVSRLTAGEGEHMAASAVEPVAESLNSALAAAARTNEISNDPVLERLLITGSELRASGNMQGALQAFREVETAMPELPRVLAELGATFGQMGLAEKAGSYWQRIEEMGPLASGAYFAIAGRQLRGEMTVGVGTSRDTGKPAPGSEGIIFKIGEIKVEEQRSTGDGQKVNLHVIVAAAPESRPAGEDLALLVYFFDQVNEGTVVASTTADTSYLYPTEPYDWQTGGTEEIVVIYHQPVFTDEQKVDLGERRYYGYVIELYYRDQLQDRVVMPESISSLIPEKSEEVGTGQTFFGPENALFPDSIQP